MSEHCHASGFHLYTSLLSVLSYYSFTCSHVMNSAAFFTNMKVTLCHEWLQQVTLPSCSPSIFSLASTKSQNFSWLSSARNSLRNKGRKVAVSWVFMLPVHNKRWWYECFLYCFPSSAHSVAPGNLTYSLVRHFKGS